MAKSIVDANYRFIAAYQEVNARVTQRQQALALYISLVVSLLAVLVALRPAGGGKEPPVEWLIIGFPVASLCLAFLNYKAERAISNLRTFLSVLEQLDNAHEHLPSYNTDPQWSHGANRARPFTTTLPPFWPAPEIPPDWARQPPFIPSASVTRRYSFMWRFCWRFFP